MTFRRAALISSDVMRARAAAPDVALALPPAVTSISAPEAGTHTIATIRKHSGAITRARTSPMDPERMAMFGFGADRSLELLGWCTARP